MEELTFFLADKKVLPKVYSKIIEAKQYIMNARAVGTSEAARMAEIPRNVFYKYKDSVYPYQPEAINRILTIQAMLYDRLSVLMSLVSEFCGAGANILTISQNIPVSGKAIVSISTRINNMMDTVDELLAPPRDADGVCSINNITNQQRIGSISF